MLNFDDARLFDVSDFAFGCEEVIRNTRSNFRLNFGESQELQQSALVKWEQERWNIKDRFFWPKARIEAWQLKMLRSLVDFAFTNTDFYYQLYSKAGYGLGAIRSLDDFARLPIITRADLIAEFPGGIISKSTDLAQCRRVRSSGSSGKPVEIAISTERADLDTLFKYRQFEIMGGLQLKANRWLYNIHHALWWHSSFAGKYPVFSLGQNCSPTVTIDHIAKLRPQVISSIASALPELAKVGVDFSELGVELISTNSEGSSKTERKMLEEAFNVPVRDEYSSESRI